MEKTHKETWSGREDEIQKKVKEVATTAKTNEKEKSSLIEEKKLSEIENFEQVADWKKHLQGIVAKVITKKDKHGTDDTALKKKDQDKITKQYADFINDIKEQSLARDHAETVGVFL